MIKIDASVPSPIKRTDGGYLVHTSFIMDLAQQVCYDWNVKLRQDFPNAFPELFEFSAGNSIFYLSQCSGVPFAIGNGLAPEGLEMKCLWVNQDYEPEIINESGRTFITFTKKTNTKTCWVLVSDAYLTEVEGKLGSSESEWKKLLRAHFPAAFEVPEKVYRNGQAFKLNGSTDTFMLIADGLKVSMVNVTLGFTYSLKPVQVADRTKITSKEFALICAPASAADFTELI